MITKAVKFASEAHKDQKRKYSGEPYFNHCAEVAFLVETVSDDEEMICAAYLHDTVEDCGVSLQTIRDEFGPGVAELVEMLTDVSKPSDGNRVARKAVDRQHTAKASARAKTVKLADLISNTRSIVALDRDFAKVYLAEKDLLLPYLTEGSATLYGIAYDLLQQGMNEIYLGDKP